MLTNKQAEFAKTNNPTYSDFRNEKTELTAKELGFFWDTAEKVLSALGIEIPVYICDHEAFEGSSANALGMHWKSEDDEFITIDNYFIHECYEVAFHGAYSIDGEDLVSVLCHELAHIKYRRHTKYHAELTEVYINHVKYDNETRRRGRT